MITADTTRAYRELIGKLVRARHEIIRERRGESTYMVTVATSNGLAAMVVKHDRLVLSYRGSVIGYDHGYDGVDRIMSHLPVHTVGGHVS